MRQKNYLYLDFLIRGGFTSEAEKSDAKTCDVTTL